MKAKATGFELPLSYQQILSWVLLTLWTFSYYAFIIPVKPIGTAVGMSFVLFACVVVVIVYGIIVIRSDPTDDFVRVYRECVKEDRSFPVSINTFCSLCSSAVQEGSKHCMVCYRCVDQFDHHCTWVNNCIGKANYYLFIKLICALEVLLVIVLGSSIDFLSYAYSHSSEYSDSVERYYGSGKDLVGIGIVMCSTITTGIVACLNTYLIVFHIYLIKKGITTYQFLKGTDNKVSAERTNEKVSEAELELLKVSN